MVSPPSDFLPPSLYFPFRPAPSAQSTPPTAYFSFLPRLNCHHVKPHSVDLPHFFRGCSPNRPHISHDQVHKFSSPLDERTPFQQKALPTLLPGTFLLPSKHQVMGHADERVPAGVGEQAAGLLLLSRSEPKTCIFHALAVKSTQKGPRIPPHHRP